MNNFHRPWRDTGAEAELSIADITERLMAEFGTQFKVSTISRVVLACRHDLQGSPVAALPELVERLARQRLIQTAAESSHLPTPNVPSHPPTKRKPDEIRAG